MYDIKPLEDKWKKYNFKKRRPYYYVVFTFIVLGIIFVITMGNFSSLKESFRKVPDIRMINFDIEKEEDKTILLINNALNILETKSKIISSNNTISLKPLVNASETLVDIPILELTDNIKENIEHKKVYLDIVGTSSLTAYEDVEKRFKQSHDIDDALFLAKSYYKKKNYKKAEQWAYEVNKLNENIEESVLIFVQSKSYLGQVNEAISILKNYIKKSNSDEARKILYNIENNNKL
jgi:tetratricopeptide (TPR) repeat protein